MKNHSVRDRMVCLFLSALVAHLMFVSFLKKALFEGIGRWNVQ